MNFKLKSILILLKSNFLLLISFISILPFIIISKYNNPYADDYCYAYTSKALGFLEAQRDFFNNLNGRYSVSAILSFDILHSEYSFLYKLFPALIILLLWLAIFTLVKTTLGIEIISKNITVASIILMLYVTQMPNVAEGIYWWSATVNYQLANVIAIFIINSVLILFKKKSLLHLIIASVLILFLGGFNETTLLMLDIFVLSMQLISLLKKKKINYSFLILLSLLFFVSLVPIISHGNSIRVSRYEGGSEFIFSFVLSIAQMGWNLITKGGIVVFFSVIIYDVIKNHIKDFEYLNISKNSFKTMLIIFFGIITAGYFTGFWALGEPLPPRARNTVFMFFILGLIFVLLVVFSKMQQVFNFFDVNKKIGFMFAIITISLALNGENYITVTKDLFKKKAYSYNKQFEERIELTKKSVKGAELQLEPFDYVPKTLVFRDLDPKNPSYVYNNCYRKYWGMKSVVLKQ